MAMGLGKLMEMGLEVSRGEVELVSLVDSVPQAPPDLSLFYCSSRRIGPDSLRKEDRPTLLLFAGSRSALKVASPQSLYPPLEQRVCCPFPFPLGSIGRETGNGSFSWQPLASLLL